MSSSKKALLLILIFWIGSVIVIFGVLASHQIRKRDQERRREDRIGQMADEIREGSNTFLVDADSFPVSGEEDEYSVMNWESTDFQAPILLHLRHILSPPTVRSASLPSIWIFPCGTEPG